MTEYDNTSVIKKIAVHETATMSDLRSAALQEHSAMFKWLLATIFAINAGGAVATLNSRLIVDDSKPLIAAAFCLGLLAAMLSGRLAQGANLKMIPSIRKLELFWIKVGEDGEFDEEEFLALEAECETARKSSWPVIAVGWVAVLMFIAGVTVAGSNTVTTHSQLQEK